MYWAVRGRRRAREAELGNTGKCALESSSADVKGMSRSNTEEVRRQQGRGEKARRHQPTNQPISSTRHAARKQRGVLATRARCLAAAEGAGTGLML